MRIVLLLDEGLSYVEVEETAPGAGFHDLALEAPLSSKTDCLVWPRFIRANLRSKLTPQFEHAYWSGRVKRLRMARRIGRCERWRR